jgi:hypothetical protein
VAQRSCGKKVACINDTIRRAITLSRPHGRFAYVAPFLAQAKEVAWKYLKRYAAPLIADKNEGELWVELESGARGTSEMRQSTIRSDAPSLSVVPTWRRRASDAGEDEPSAIYID